MSGFRVPHTTTHLRSYSPHIFLSTTHLPRFIVTLKQARGQSSKQTKRQKEKQNKTKHQGDNKKPEKKTTVSRRCAINPQIMLVYMSSLIVVSLLRLLFSLSNKFIHFSGSIKYPCKLTLMPQFIRSGKVISQAYRREGK